MFRDGDSNVETCTTWSGAAAELVLFAVALDVVTAPVVLATVAVVEAGEELAVTVTIFSVTVFVPLDPQPATSSPTAANPANAPIALVTIESLYADQPTGRFNT